MKMNRFLIFAIIISLCSCSDIVSEESNELLVVRVERKTIAKDLIKSGVSYYQQGQTVTLTVPSDKLFKPGTTVSRVRSDRYYKDIVALINSYRVEKVEIQSHLMADKSSLNKDYSRTQAQMVQESLKTNGINAGIVVSKGMIDSMAKGKYGLNKENYIKIQFRFLRILV